MKESYLIINDGSNNELLFEEELISYLNENKTYFPVSKFPTTKQFLLNFISALYFNQPITLLDSNFSLSEIEDLGLLSKFGKEKGLEKSKSENGYDWIDKIKSSKSIISLFTSGTTGIPKIVHHTVETLIRMVKIGRNYESNVWALAYNPTHIAGLQVIFQALLNRNTILNVFDCSIDQVGLLLNEFHVTNISATPTFYRMLASLKQEYPLVLRVTVGGERSSLALIDKLKNIFPNSKINNIYASTELGSLFVSSGNDFKIPENLKPYVTIDDNGELFIHASLVPNRKIESEWYGTGDLVEVKSLDPLVFIFLSRKTEMINVGGYKVNPSEVESIIVQFPLVMACLVYGRPNSVLGQVLCVDIKLINEDDFDKKSLLQYLKSELQDFKVPRIINIVEKVELTRTGKLTRKK